jgi:hypothetical protein
MPVVDGQRHFQFHYHDDVRQLRNKDDKNVWTFHEERQNYREDFQF